MQWMKMGQRPGALVQGTCVLAMALCALVGMGSTALAQQAPGGAGAGMESGSLADQLDMDLTPIPVGMGALFVPSMTRAEVEPPIQVFFDGQRVAWGRTGERIVLPPGEYKVVVGQGPAQARPSSMVRVIDGVTTPVEVFFAALRVTAVDPDGNPIEVPYELIDARAGTSWGQRRTPAEGSAGDKTWILPAQPVKIVLGGAEGTAITLPMGAGQLIRYRLVVDRGQLVRAELADKEIIREERWWRLRWVVGGDFSFNRTQGQLGAFNGDAMRFGIFTRASIGIDYDNHLALLNLDVDESWIGFESVDGQELALQKLADEARLELLYNYRLGRIFGPYVRAQVRTAFFETTIRPPQDATLELSEDNVRRNIALDGEEDFTLFKALRPMEIREGVGLSLSPVDNDVFDLGLRVGVGARQAYYDDGIVIIERDGRTLKGVRLGDDESFGAELTLTAGLRLGQTFSWEGVADFYLPVDQFDGLEEFDDLTPVFRFDNAFTMSVNSFLSVVYNLNIRREAYEIDDPQLSHILSLRLQHTLF